MAGPTETDRAAEKSPPVDEFGNCRIQVSGFCHAFSDSVTGNFIDQGHLQAVAAVTASCLTRDGKHGHWRRITPPSRRVAKNLQPVASRGFAGAGMEVYVSLQSNSMIDPVKLFEQAIKLGPLALLRLRAEGLLGRGDDGTILLTEDERERLKRIMVAPNLDDREEEFVEILTAFVPRPGLRISREVFDLFK